MRFAERLWARAWPWTPLNGVAPDVMFRVEATAVRRIVLSYPEHWLGPPPAYSLEEGSHGLCYMVKRSPRYSSRLSGSLMRKSRVPSRLTLPS